TAHTLDDETQTILLNMLHGDPLRIAREKPMTDQVHPKLVQRIKPFCRIPEKETTLYAYTKGLFFQDMPCPYSSEAMRNDIRIFLNRMEQKHTSTKFTIFRSIQRIRPAIEDITKEDEMQQCSRCGEPTTQITCRACQMLRQHQDKC
ncbi:MAG: TIGR00269 family protein, partial [Candidatus Korarchaeota archaeon]|nr:TIGR00269 family protein [Candidatus Korarchaeota archaeon]